MSMNFWEVEGQKIESNGTIEVEGGSSNGLPIPAGTQVRVVIDEAVWKTTEKEGTFINVKHKVIAPEVYKGRVIFQKIHVRIHEFKSAPNWCRLDEAGINKKRAAALRMLAAIDANAGGKLMATPSAPTDDKLSTCLCGKQMALTLDTWEITTDQNGQQIPNAVDYARGNWVKKVEPNAAFSNMSKEDQEKAKAATDAQWQRMLEQAGGQQAPRPSQGGGNPAPRPSAPAGNDFDSFDDDIPF